MMGISRDSYQQSLSAYSCCIHWCIHWCIAKRPRCYLTKYPAFDCLLKMMDIIINFIRLAACGWWASSYHSSMQRLASGAGDVQGIGYLCGAVYGHADAFNFDAGTDTTRMTGCHTLRLMYTQTRPRLQITRSYWQHDRQTTPVMSRLQVTNELAQKLCEQRADQLASQPYLRQLHLIWMPVHEMLVQHDTRLICK